VTLLVSDGKTQSSLSKLVTLADLPFADFEYSIQDLIVSFSDTSTGGVTGWSWNFGDGAVSAARNPYHIYALPGTYPVGLTVTNSAGSTTVTKDVRVTGTIPEEQPDIVVGEILEIPDRLIPGEKLMIPVEIRNQGTAPAGSFFNYYYLSPDMKYSADDIWLGSQFIAALRENGTITQLAILSIPPRISEGEYYVIAIGDATNVITESDENNIMVTPDSSLLTGKVAVTKTSMDTLFTGSFSKQDYLRNISTR
jgi:PKD repeat protein